MGHEPRSSPDIYLYCFSGTRTIVDTAAAVTLQDNRDGRRKMERTRSIFNAIPLICYLLFPSPSLATEQPAKQWEYRVIRAGDFEGNAPIKRLDEWQEYMAKVMNDLGKEGWELVSVSRGEGLVMFFFKRSIN